MLKLVGATMLLFAEQALLCVCTLEILLPWHKLKYRYSWRYYIKFRNAGSVSRTILSTP